MTRRHIVLTILLAFMVTCVTYLIMNNVVPGIVHAQPNSGFFNSLTVGELHVIGKEGDGRIVLKNLDGKPVIFFKTDEKNIRGQLGISDSGGFGIGCFDKKGKTVIILGEVTNGQLVLGMMKNKAKTGFLVDEKQAMLRLASGKTRSAIDMAAGPDNSSITIHDQEGRRRCSMMHKENFGSYFGLSDELGVDRFVAGLTAKGENKIVLSKAEQKEIFLVGVSEQGSEIRLANASERRGPSFNLMYKNNTPLMRMINGNGDEIWASPSFQNQPPIVVTKKGKRVWEVPKR